MVAVDRIAAVSQTAPRSVLPYLYSIIIIIIIIGLC